MHAWRAPRLGVRAKVESRLGNRGVTIFARSTDRRRASCSFEAERFRLGVSDVARGLTTTRAARRSRGSYRARRGALGVCALASGVPSTSASRRRGGMPRSGAFADSRAHRDDFDTSRALLPDPTPEGGNLERLPDIADASHPPGAPSDRLPPAPSRDVAADPAESLSPAITRSFIWIVLPLFLLCHACFCGCNPANDDRVVSRTFAQGPQRRRRRRDRRRRDHPDDPRRRADADDDEDDYDPEYAFEAGRRRQPRAPPIDDVDDDGGVPPAAPFAVAALPRRVAPFPAAAAAVDDARGGRDFATDTCAICCEDVEGGQTLCALPCGHAFHDECACAWLEIRGSCPTCRASVPSVEPGGAGKSAEPGERAGGAREDDETVTEETASEMRTVVEDDVEVLFSAMTLPGEVESAGVADGGGGVEGHRVGFAAREDP